MHAYVDIHSRKYSPRLKQTLSQIHVRVQTTPATSRHLQACVVSNGPSSIFPALWGLVLAVLFHRYLKPGTSILLKMVTGQSRTIKCISVILLNLFPFLPPLSQLHSQYQYTNTHTQIDKHTYAHTNNTRTRTYNYIFTNTVNIEPNRSLESHGILCINAIIMPSYSFFFILSVDFNLFFKLKYSKGFVKVIEVVSWNQK